jgi:hypothetical protein
MADDDDRVIRFPGSQPAPAAPPAPPAASVAKAKAKRSEPPATERPPDPADLDEDRRKAISVILSGMPFVCIGIQPSPTGADFFTSLGGDTAELAKAQPHLDGVIDRLFQKRGIR